MEADAAAYAGLGLYVVGSTVSTTNTWIHGLFTANGYDNIHNFKGSVQSSIWIQYGYSGVLQYKILIDRDGHIRKTGYGFGQFEQTIEECLGIN